MSHYAKIENSQVTNIIVAEQEFINSGAVGNPIDWVEIIDDNGSTIHYAGIGFTYNATSATFIPPKPFNSWLVNGTSWSAPIPKPQDNKHYIWNEEILNWTEINSVLPGIE